MNNNKDNEQLNDYRVDQLEKRVDALGTDVSITKDSVLRIEAKLATVNLTPPCLLHNQRLDTLEKSITNLNSVADELKTFKTQVFVYGTIIVFLITTLGPVIVDRVWPDSAAVTVGLLSTPKTNHYVWNDGKTLVVP